MSLKDQAAQAAEEWMASNNPTCESCGSNGQWKFGVPQFINKFDTETGVSSNALIVTIACAKCGHEKEHFEQLDN